jgi:hypothetical protein
LRGINFTPLIYQSCAAADAGKPRLLDHRSLLKRAAAGDDSSNSSRFKKLLTHVLACGNAACAVPGCLPSRDVLVQAIECRKCEQVGRRGRCLRLRALRDGVA